MKLHRRHLRLRTIICPTQHHTLPTPVIPAVRVACVVEVSFGWHRLTQHDRITVRAVCEPRGRVAQVESAGELAVEVDKDPGLEVMGVNEVAGGEDAPVGDDVGSCVGGRRRGVRPGGACPVGISGTIRGGGDRGTSQVYALGLGNCGEQENVVAGHRGGGTKSAVLNFASLGERLGWLWGMGKEDVHRKV